MLDSRATAMADGGERIRRKYDTRPPFRRRFQPTWDRITRTLPTIKTARLHVSLVVSRHYLLKQTMSRMAVPVYDRRLI